MVGMFLPAAIPIIQVSTCQQHAVRRSWAEVLIGEIVNFEPGKAGSSPEAPCLEDPETLPSRYQSCLTAVFKYQVSS